MCTRISALTMNITWAPKVVVKLATNTILAIILLIVYFGTYKIWVESLKWPFNMCLPYCFLQVLWQVFAGNIIHCEVETREEHKEIASSSSASSQLSDQRTWGGDSGHWTGIRELGKLAMLSTTRETGEVKWCGKSSSCFYQWRFLGGVGPLWLLVLQFLSNHDGASLEVVFQVEWWATYFSSLRAKLILAPLFVNPHTTSKCGRCHMQINQIPAKSHAELEDKTNGTWTWVSETQIYTSYFLRSWCNPLWCHHCLCVFRYGFQGIYDW